MTKHWTFALLKPDAVANPISIKWLLDAIYQRGLKVEEGCRMILSQEKAAELYSTHKDAFFYRRLIRHVCSGPVVAMKLELKGMYHEDCVPLSHDVAIKLWRELLGPSKLFANMYLAECFKGENQFNLSTFRQLFALSDTRNFGHGSDSPEELQKEYSIFKHFMNKIEDPAIELFHLDRYMVDDGGVEDDEGKEMDRPTEWGILHK